MMNGIAYDITWSVAAAAALVLLGMALTRWFREDRGGSSSAITLLILVFVPVIGPAAYLVARKKQGERATEEVHP